jgi:hypothetical protein
MFSNLRQKATKAKQQASPAPPPKRVAGSWWMLTQHAPHSVVERNSFDSPRLMAKPPDIEKEREQILLRRWAVECIQKGSSLSVTEEATEVELTVLKRRTPE